MDMEDNHLESPRKLPLALLLSTIGTKALVTGRCAIVIVYHLVAAYPDEVI